MTNREIIESYIPLAEFIARICGPRCEVLLHDLSDLERSIIFLENGQITGRAVGGGITDFALRTVFSKKYTDKAFVANYCGQAFDGARTLKSSTFYIRDKAGEIIGLLCTNVDITEAMKYKAILDGEVEIAFGEKQSGPAGAGAGKLVNENFSRTVGDLVDTTFKQTRDETGLVDPVHMLVEEKKEFVLRLYEKNLFMIKGAVGEVAKRLRISEPTVYRYLREISQPE